jgi:hypothetical protein
MIGGERRDYGALFDGPTVRFEHRHPMSALLLRQKATASAIFRSGPNKVRTRENCGE